MIDRIDKICYYHIIYYEAYGFYVRYPQPFPEGAGMTRRQLYAHGPGGAAYVLAHAIRQSKRGRGHRPSMHYIGQHNAAIAQAIAALVWEQMNKQREAEVALSKLPRLTPRQAIALGENELRKYIRRIVIECRTAQELAKRLYQELGVVGASITWVVPLSRSACENRDFMYISGLLFSRTGASVSLVAFGPNGDTIMM